MTTKKVASAPTKGAPTAKHLTTNEAPVAKKVTSSSTKGSSSTKAGPASKKAVSTTTKTVSATKATKAAPAAAKATKADAPAAKATKAAPAVQTATGTSSTRSTPAAPPVANAATKAAVPAAPKKPTVGPYASEPKFLDEQRGLLLEERAIHQGQAEDLRAEADSLALEREPGDVQFDEESGEGGTVAVDRERDLALSAQAALAVEEIDDALRRIDRKTYGACERCREPIPKVRLRALPFARLCVACKSGGLSRR